MLSKSFSSLRAMAVLAILASLVMGCASTASPSMDASGTYVFVGRHGDNNLYRPLLYRLPATCAGRTVELRALYRTNGVQGGTQTYHGIHFDYEVFASGGVPVYPIDWKAEPSVGWQEIVRRWELPADMRSGFLRIGLQGVDGALYVRDVSVSPCH